MFKSTRVLKSLLSPSLADTRGNGKSIREQMGPLSQNTNDKEMCPRGSGREIGKSIQKAGFVSGLGHCFAFTLWHYGGWLSAFISQYAIQHDSDLQKALLRLISMFCFWSLCGSLNLGQKKSNPEELNFLNILIFVWSKSDHFTDS